MAITTPRTLRGWLQLPLLFLAWLCSPLPLVGRIFTRTRRTPIQVKFLTAEEARAMHERERRRAMSIRHWCARHEGRGFRVKPAGVPIDPRWFWKRDALGGQLWRLTRRPLEI